MTSEPQDNTGASSASLSGEAPKPFSRKDLLSENLSLLNSGRWGNADLFLCHRNGEAWVVKDFARRSLPVRHLLGRTFVRREMSALKRLNGLPGIPQRCFRLDRFALCYKFIPGQTLKQVKRNELGRDFFLQLEQLIRSMHQRGVVHLDVRYRRNVLVSDAGLPVLLDFQTSLHLDGVPAFLRAFLMSVDLSAVNKLWWKKSPDSFEPKRLARLRRFNRIRRLWIFTGYLFRIRSLRHFLRRAVKKKEAPR